ncbi:MAG: sulfate permease, SulP family [Alphaproteobacteria bacterium]|jgi:MFS superfamily sulfate permease-like transporter/CRP-like cAMP-binding protein|nr:sulfate permease, SulP family [Alphaproteobacteria bacterium]
MSDPWLSNIRNDVVGGLVSAAVAIPLAVGYGMFAFVSLGDEYFADGALAGLYTAFIVGLVSVITGDKTTTVYAPRVTSTFFIGLLLYHLIHSDAAFLRSGGPSLVLVVFFSIILLAGAFQALFGLIKLGTLIKFTPHPVMAGFQNAAALLLFLVQLGNVFGFDRNTPYTAVFDHLDLAKPLSILIAVVTCIAMWNARKILAKVPPVFVGLALGSGLYYTALALGFGSRLGPVIGSSTNAALNPSLIPNFPGLVHDGSILEILPTIFAGATALALIASIDALLCARLVARPGDEVDGNRLLVRLGIGNMFAAGFGGITSGINIGASLVNRAFGGRTPLSVLVNCAAIFLAFSLLFPLIAAVPRVVLSAVIMVIAVQHFDPWTMQMLRRVVSSSAKQRQHIILELCVVLLVAVLSITVNIVTAVFIGIVIAVMLFVVRMSRSNIRRMYRCDGIHSRKSRPPKEMELLERMGGGILVMELEGALFFGSAERLANDIDTAMQRGAQWLVLDLRRVNEIDSTGAHILLGINAALAGRGKYLAVAIARHSETAARLADLDVLEGVTAGKVFDDVDRAIEWAEDALLRAELSEPGQEQEVPLEQVSILTGFQAEDMAAVKTHLTRVTPAMGSIIFQEGDAGKELFIITKGTASAYLRQPHGGDIRLATFAPGTVFGELALLDAGLRSASVIANSDLICYSLSEASFAALSAQTPAVAIKLLSGLGRELSGRLRRANRTIHQLEI